MNINIVFALQQTERHKIFISFLSLSLLLALSLSLSSHAAHISHRFLHENEDLTQLILLNAVRAAFVFLNFREVYSFFCEIKDKSCCFDAIYNVNTFYYEFMVKSLRGERKLLFASYFCVYTTIKCQTQWIAMYM